MRKSAEKHNSSLAWFSQRAISGQNILRQKRQIVIQKITLLPRTCISLCRWCFLLKLCCSLPYEFLLVWFATVPHTNIKNIHLLTLSFWVHVSMNIDHCWCFIKDLGRVSLFSYEICLNTSSNMLAFNNFEVLTLAFKCGSVTYDLTQKACILIFQHFCSTCKICAFQLVTEDTISDALESMSLCFFFLTRPCCFKSGMNFDCALVGLNTKICCSCILWLLHTGLTSISVRLQTCVVN